MPLSEFGFDSVYVAAVVGAAVVVVEAVVKSWMSYSVTMSIIVKVLMHFIRILVLELSGVVVLMGLALLSPGLGVVLLVSPVSPSVKGQRGSQ